MCTLKGLNHKTFKDKLLEDGAWDLEGEIRSTEVNASYILAAFECKFHF